MIYKQWEDRLFDSVQGVVRLIVDNIPDNGVFVDVGANVGLVTDCVLKVKPNLIVHMFEPVEDYANYCKEKFPNAIVNKLALSNTAGYCTMALDPSNLGYNVAHKSHEGIPMITLSGYLENTKVDLIKIDAEGSDCDILEGTFDYLRKGFRPCIIIEVGWDAVRESEVIEHMEKVFGYTANKIGSDVLLKCEL